MRKILRNASYYPLIVLLGLGWYISSACAENAAILTDVQLKTYILTIDHVNRVIAATRAMQLAVKKDSLFRNEYLTSREENLTLDQAVNSIRLKRPRHVAIILKEGISLRDYLLSFTALLEADAVNRQIEESSSFRDYVNPKNLKFVREHPSTIQMAIREIIKLNNLQELGDARNAQK